jgi:hypothetical protein
MFYAGLGATFAHMRLHHPALVNAGRISNGVMSWACQFANSQYNHPIQVNLLYEECMQC